jgi:RNA polymerase sigma-32 factor
MAIDKKNKPKKSNLPARTGETRPALKSPLEKYMQEVSRYPLMTQDEEFKAAVAHYDNQDREAAHRLVTANLRLVVKIAHDFRRARLSILDLIQEGNYGLMKAVQKYNPYKGVKLSSYAAWWIKAYILKYLMDNKSQVKMGTTAAQRKLFYNLQKETQRLLQKYETVTPRLLADSLDVKESEVVEMQKRLGSPDVSMDAPIKNSDGSAGETRANLIPDQTVSIEEGVSQSQVAEIFSEHLSAFEQTLKGRDLQIFKERILSENPKTLREIGEGLGVTRERARQLESRIIKNLKKFVEEDGRLTEFSED